MDDKLLNEMSKLIFPDLNDSDTIESLEEMFPPRNLPEGAKVTRMAPSPTGSMHLGNLYSALADERIAHTSKDGIFFLRIEDTDEKRKVPGAVEKIIKYLNGFGLFFDEGATADGDLGNYGPYRQRMRAKFYHIVARKLLLDGRAYPCFCTEEQLEEAHKAQESAKDNFGYYGKYAVHRNMPSEEAIEKIKNGEKFVLRFRSLGNPAKKIPFKDSIKGNLELPENDQDFILLKSDGIPTYHLAHIVDDHFMRTTDVVRGEEWLSTLPWHLELWNACGFKRPRYSHTSQVLKFDEQIGTKRKMSKRKDPECTLEFYYTAGYPRSSVIEYLMTLLNSNYEQWRSANQNADYREFPFSSSKMSASGALFDIAKLNDISKDVISRMSADEVYLSVSEWAKEYNPEFYSLISRDPEYSKSIFSIGRGGKKPRKDFACWSEVPAFISYFFDETFSVDSNEFPANISVSDRKAILSDYAKIYKTEQDNNSWFETVKIISEKYGFTSDMKSYKANPDAFKGSVADVSTVLRVAVTGRQNSPDLFAICNLLGEEKVKARVTAQS